MGSIIREDTEGGPSAVLTETGKGGLFSQGYLRDAPAREYVEEGETPVFVLTDDETGIERERAGEHAAISPGKGYRSITVVTDRRVIVLVGNAEDGGDRRVTLPLVEITAARSDGGVLVLTTAADVTWRCHAGAAGVDDVAEYVSAAAAAWREVEATLDSVKRELVAATAHRDDGAYDEALAAMGTARDDVEVAQRRSAAFEAEWPGEAIASRVAGVRDRCLRTAAEIRVGHARATIDEGEAHWRRGEYERARDAFDEARAAFEAVGALEPRHRRDVEDVDAAIERLDRSTERLDDAPLRSAIDADRRAREHDPGQNALDALAEARERYDAVLELDPDGDERRFAGDRDRIREQREDVTDRFVETALDVGADALAAGKWHCETGQGDLAVEELERAVEFLDRGRSVADPERPARADEMEKLRATARDRLSELHDADAAHVEAAEKRTTESTVADARDGQDGKAAADGGVAARPKTASGTDGDEDDGDGAEHGHCPGAGNGTAAGHGTEAGSDMEAGHDTADATAGLRDLSPAEFERVVTTVVEAKGWRPEPTASAAVDFLATCDDVDGTLGIAAFPDEDGEPIGPETIRERATLATSVPGVDDVLIVAARPLTDAARAAAESDGLRVLDAEYLADVLSGPDVTAVRTTVPGE